MISQLFLVGHTYPDRRGMYSVLGEEAAIYRSPGFTQWALTNSSSLLSDLVERYGFGSLDCHRP